MKKILSLVLAAIMIVTMTIPAFATASDEISPCAAGCNGNHVYQQASTNTTYTHNATTHTKTVITYYKCIYCPSTTQTSQTSTSAHEWKYLYPNENGNGSYFQCTECGCYKIVD